MLLFLLGCAEPSIDLRPPRPPREPLEDTGVVETDAIWTVLVYLVGDNDLESYVMHDLNELEAGGPGGAVRVLVLADRAEGYDDADGDWTGTRVYDLHGDDKLATVTSPVLADWGELDMADPETLARFLMFGAATAPAEHYALVLWNHGSGWYVDGQPPPGIGWDDGSEDDLSIAEGELNDGLRVFTDAHGPLDLVAFDACNMAYFEVAHSLREHADTMVAAQTWVGWDGLQYTPAIAALVADPTLDGAALADRMARDPVEITGELTFSATDLSRLDAVAAALDTLSGIALDEPEAWEALVAARAAARGVEPGEGDGWRREYMDLGDLGAQVAASSHPALAASGVALSNELASAMIGNYRVEEFAWAGGLNIYADTTFATFYSTAPGATWSQATRWDEVLVRLAIEER
ncbi:MAG: clostripain-related cysteine peptidase [Myxococcota bacterium]